MRGLLVFFIALSSAIALIQYNSEITFIAQLMGISWGALAGAFLAPFLYSLYWKGTSRASIWACFIFGVGFTTSNMFFSFITSPINAGAIVMLIGFALVPIVSIFTKKQEKTELDSIFSCYDEMVTVAKKDHLKSDM